MLLTTYDSLLTTNYSLLTTYCLLQAAARYDREARERKEERKEERTEERTEERKEERMDDRKVFFLTFLGLIALQFLWLLGLALLFRGSTST